MCSVEFCVIMWLLLAPLSSISQNESSGANTFAPNMYLLQVFLLHNS